MLIPLALACAPAETADSTADTESTTSARVAPAVYVWSFTCDGADAPWAPPEMSRVVGAAFMSAEGPDAASGWASTPYAVRFDAETVYVFNESDPERMCDAMLLHYGGRVMLTYI